MKTTNRCKKKINSEKTQQPNEIEMQSIISNNQNFLNITIQPFKFAKKGEKGKLKISPYIYGSKLKFFNLSSLLSCPFSSGLFKVKKGESACQAANRARAQGCYLQTFFVRLS